MEESFPILPASLPELGVFTAFQGDNIRLDRASSQDGLFYELLIVKNFTKFCNYETFRIKLKLALRSVK